jgi:hypothetical protein
MQCLTYLHIQYTVHCMHAIQLLEMKQAVSCHGIHPVRRPTDSGVVCARVALAAGFACVQRLMLDIILDVVIGFDRAGADSHSDLASAWDSFQEGGIALPVK